MKQTLVTILHYASRFLDWINKPEVLLLPFVLCVIAMPVLLMVAPERFREAAAALNSIPGPLQVAIGIMVLGLVVEASLNRMEREGVPQYLVWDIYAKFKLAVWLALLGLVITGWAS